MHKTGVSVITITGDRPEAFGICTQYVQRQCFDGLIQWIVVDDGVDCISLPAEMITGFTIAHMMPMNDVSICRNMKKALSLCEFDQIVIMKDDDWYHPFHVEYLSSALNSSDLVGNSFGRYYNISEMKFKSEEKEYPSFGRTGFNISVVPTLIDLLEVDWKDLETRLWGSIYRQSKNEGSDLNCRIIKADTVISMDGMPGRRNAGHQDESIFSFEDDPDGCVLREWIGSDADLYNAYLGF